MKTKILSYITIGASILGVFSSCSESFTPALERTGQVSLTNMGISVNNTSLNNLKMPASRDVYDVSGYLVRIFNSDNSLVGNWRFEDMPDIITLPVGKNYRVDVVSHEVEKAAWEAPLFAGSQTFDIADSQITDLGSIECTFSSLKVTVEFSDEMRKAMGDDVEVRIVANDAGELVFTPNETRAGYFEVIPGSNTLAYHFTGTINGNYESLHHVYTDVEAGQYRIIKFSMKGNNTQPDEETGQINPSTGINVSTDVNEINYNGELPAEEEIITPTHPGNNEQFVDPEEPENPDQPTPPVTEVGKIDFTSALSFDTEMDPAAQESGIVDIYVEKLIDHLNVTIKTDSKEFESVLESVNVPLQFDMAHPTDADAGVMELLGQSADNIYKKSDVKFDITQFLGLLFYAGKHQFIIEVIDMDGNKDSRTLTFVVK